MIICGTGHRPDKLGGYGPEVRNAVTAVARKALEEIRPDKGIMGGALGFDQGLGWAFVQLGIPFTAALPFKDFDSKWPSFSRGQLNLLCSHAKDVVYVCDPGYAPWKMQSRNEWMVDRADTVLALWNGTTGGTANCLRYAEKVSKQIVNLWDKYRQPAIPRRGSWMQQDYDDEFEHELDQLHELDGW